MSAKSRPSTGRRDLPSPWLLVAIVLALFFLCCAGMMAVGLAAQS